MIRNADPGSTAGVPGLSLPAGLTTEGLPIGLGLGGPIGSDGKLVGLGQSRETLLGAPQTPDL